MTILLAAAISLATFANPPRTHGPCVWWQWMNGNVSKAGITADLEAMAATGIAGVHVFDAGCGIPAGPVRFGTDAWYGMLLHAIRECGRLGLSFGIANCSGWANSGGPWVTPADSMKYVQASETPVRGPAKFAGVLPRTKEDHGFYEDIAVLAVRERAPRLPEVTTVMTGCLATVTCAEPVRVTGVDWRMAFDWTYRDRAMARIEISRDGKSFETLEESLPVVVADFNTSLWGVHSHTFARPVELRALRFTLTPGRRPLTLKAFRLETATHVEDLEAKMFRVKAPFRPTVTSETVGAIDPSETVDLTGRMAPDGRLDWDVPAGDWTILRLGYSANGMHLSGEYTEGGYGLEVDKLDPAAVARHFDAYAGKLKRLAGKDGGAYDMVLNDSYEAESQNWTRGFEKEFASRAGYSIVPFLPVLAGKVVSSLEETEKFLADYRKALSDLFAENYAGTLRRKCNELGMRLYLEPYGNGPLDDESYTRHCDVPMCEFWSTAAGFNTDVNGEIGGARGVVAAARKCGKRLIAAEAFTCGPGAESGRWLTTPFSVKCQGDAAFAEGVNQLFFQRFCHQPFDPPKYPGMTFGQYGMHFDRTQTWWAEAREYVRYLTRCQYLLQTEGMGVDRFFVCAANRGETTVERSFPVAGRTPEVWYPETGEAFRPRRWSVKDGRTTVAVRLPTAGSAFVVFRSDYAADVPLEPRSREVLSLPDKGPWHVSFASPAGCEPPPADFEELVDWAQSDDPRLRGFSGSATYEKTVRPPVLKPGERLVLDLGEVHEFATVTVNGKTFPALWKPPYRVDVTDAASDPAKPLELRIRITNLWPNRLIADDALPEAQRGTWTSWRHWTAQDKPLRSGLLGPVRLSVEQTAFGETARWQAEIDRVAAAGGGKVAVPAGIHPVGTLFLRSGVTLELERNAVLLGSADFDDYPDVRIEYAEVREPWQGLVVAEGQHDVAVVGEGTIDGNGAAYPYDTRLGRPRGLVFYRCRNVRLEGVTLREPASWTCYLKECDGVVVRNVTVDSHANGNNDGIDIDSRNVLVEGCRIDSDDDGVVLKSDNPGFTVENVEVRDCEVRSCCSALKLGTGSHGGFKDIRFHDIVCDSARREVRDPKSGRVVLSDYRVNCWPGSTYDQVPMNGIVVESVDGAAVDGVSFRNVDIRAAAVPIFIRAGFRTARKWGNVELGIPPGSGRTLRNVTIEDVKARQESFVASSVTGIPGLRVQGVTLRRVEISVPGAGEAGRAAIRQAVPEQPDRFPESNMFGGMLPAYGFYLRHADGVTFDDVRVSVRGEEVRREVVMDDVTAFKRQGKPVEGEKRR